MNHSLTLSLFLVLSGTVFCQELKTTLQNLSVNNDTIINTIALRFGVGVHNYLNAEIGISAMSISQRTLHWGAASLYSTIVIQQNNWIENTYSPGVKIGIQSSYAIFMFGIEFKTLFFEGEVFNYLSPKIGFSWLDVLNIEYAINTIQLNKDYSINSRHQFSINMSINRNINNNIYRDL